MTLAVLASLTCASLSVVADEKARAFTFGRADLGKVPSGWRADKTGKGEGSVWKIVEDTTAPSKKGYVLAQTAESPGSMFNLCVAEDTKHKDVEVSVAFKAVAGKKDQGGGIVWRYQDANNYYVARMNPLEDNFRVYKVVAGKRTELESADVKVPTGEWHTIRIEMKGDAIECYLDGKKHLAVKDTTFKDAGKVGLWSKADAQTHFDDFRVSDK
jgi:hypothetical protein